MANRVAGLHLLDFVGLLLVSRLANTHLSIGDDTAIATASAGSGVTFAVVVGRCLEHERYALLLRLPYKQILADLIVFLLHEVVEFDKIAVLLTLFQLLKSLFFFGCFDQLTPFDFFLPTRVDDHALLGSHVRKQTPLVVDRARKTQHIDVISLLRLKGFNFVVKMPLQHGQMRFFHASHPFRLRQLFLLLHLVVGLNLQQFLESELEFFHR